MFFVYMITTAAIFFDSTNKRTLSRSLVLAPQGASLEPNLKIDVNSYSDGDSTYTLSRLWPHSLQAVQRALCMLFL